CRRFDGAIKGYGGCPMAKDELTGNMPTEKMLTYFKDRGHNLDLNMNAFEDAYNDAASVFL
ncbi:MAG: hydroxymethylglutaryl-CoA lyase, partial [Bacteroidia bacterium]|nr:hydroxymethylglutaryl-CoA lyase [Bacteroidia bacterium]